MKRSLVCLLLAATLLLSGCVARTDFPRLAEQSVPLPEPGFDVEIPLADSLRQKTAEARLWYRSQDGKLTEKSKAIEGASVEELCRRALHGLTSEATFQQASLVPDGLTLALVDCANGLAIVNAAGAMPSGTNERLSLWEAIGDALGSIEQVDSVLFTFEQSGIGVAGVPVGTVGPAEGAIGQRSAEFAGSAFEREVALFFPSIDGAYLVPEVRTIAFTKDDWVEPILAALAEGSEQYTAGVRRVSHPALGAGDAQLALGEDGQRRIVLGGEGRGSAADEAAIARTLLGFVPEAKEVVVQGEAVGFEEACQVPVGDCAPLLFVTAGGELAQVDTVVSDLSLRTLLAAQMAGAGGEGSVFPAGLSEEDVLAVGQEGGLLVVNLSADFLHSSAGCSAEEERNMVYAMVNLFCRLDGVEEVLFALDGKPLQSLAGSVYLRAPLKANPGLAK